MRSNRNSLPRLTFLVGSIDDWEMRSNRNRPRLMGCEPVSIDDWEMRSNRNPVACWAALSGV